MQSAGLNSLHCAICSSHWQPCYCSYWVVPKRLSSPAKSCALGYLRYLRLPSAVPSFSAPQFVQCIGPISNMIPLIFGNGTDVVHWKPGCNTRGTFDIISTCVITMLLCVWTAVHLNVPSPGSVWKPRLKKVLWLFLALVAPELVLCTAWYVRAFNALECRIYMTTNTYK